MGGTKPPKKEDEKMATKKYNLSIVVLAVLALSVVHLPPAYAEDSPADTKQVLIFLKDVIGIDVEKYEVTLVSSGIQTYNISDNPKYKGTIHTDGVYGFAYWDFAKETYSSLKVTFAFINTTLRNCGLEINAGAPHTIKPLSSNLLEAAGTFLERYEAFIGDTEVSALQSMLATVDVTKNTTKTGNNLRLEIITNTNHNRTLFRWFNTINGVDYSSLSLEFKDGFFLNFYDDRSYSKIGSSEVNVSKEQAIDKALKEANGFSYTYNGKLIDNITIVEDQIRAELKANIRDWPFVYYPCWRVDLPLNDVYPGFIYYIEVLLWADTGEVISCKEMGYGGPLPNDAPNYSSPTDSSPTTTSTPENVTPTQIENGTLPPSTTIIAVIVAAVLIPTLIAAIVLKKKKSKKQLLPSFS
jgi:hypothetical protein